MMTCREELIRSAKYDFANDLDGRWETLIEAETLSIKEEAAAAPDLSRCQCFLTCSRSERFESVTFWSKL